MRVVGLMARVTKRAAGMLRGDHLRKVLGLGGVLFVAAPAEIGNIGQGRLMRRRVVGVGMGRLRTVARFAGDMGVLAGGARLGLLVVAHHAGVLAGERDGVLADDVERRCVIVTVLAESLRDQRGADQQKGGESNDQNDSGANEMTRVTQKLAQGPSFPKERWLSPSKTGSKRS